MIIYSVFYFSKSYEHYSAELIHSFTKQDVAQKYCDKLTEELNNLNYDYSDAPDGYDNGYFIKETELDGEI